MTEWENYVRM